MSSRILRIALSALFWTLGIPVMLSLIYGFLVYQNVYGETPSENLWYRNLQPEILKIDRDFEGELGVYVKDLQSGEVYSLNALQPWYYASVIKVFVLIELLRQREHGLLDLDQKIELKRDFFRDGAGPTHQESPGRQIKVGTLVNRMMQFSDNSATDILIELVGIENVNRVVKSLFPKEKIGEIITMLEVRYRIFSEMHPSARNLSNMDFISIKQIKNLNEKVQRLSSLLRLPTFLFHAQTVEEAYRRYYEKAWNTGPLETLGLLMEMLYRGKVVSQAVSEEILKIMRSCKTGGNRLRAGLPSGYLLAHKTGTKFARSCDVGVVTAPSSQSLVLAVCAKNFKGHPSADKMMREVAEAVIRSGVFGRQPAAE